MKFLLAKKINMSQIFTDSGEVVPVTVLEVLPAKVTAVKTADKHGYEAVQIEAASRKKEFRVKAEDYQIGQEIKVENFAPGEVINIQGVSKGRGFAGAVKRYGFHGAPASHGHDHPRAVGAIGQRFPQHVRPGLRMAGRMGGGTSTVKNSVIVSFDAARNLLLVKGGVPGAPGGILKIVATGKVKKT